MRKYIDYIFNESVFKLLFITALLILLVPYMHYYFAAYLKYLLAYGILVCIWNLVGGNLVRTIRESKENILIVAFALLYLVSVFLNRGELFTSNIKQLVYMIVIFALFCLMPKVHDEDYIRKEFLKVTWLFIVLSFIAALVAVVFLAFGITEYYHFVEDDYLGISLDTQYYLGFVSGRLHGLFNPNGGASVYLLSILTSFCLWIIGVKQNTFVRAFLIGNSVVQLVCLVLTGSRGAIITLVLIIVITAVFFVVIRKANKKTCKVILMVLLALTLFVGVCIFVVPCVLGRDFKSTDVTSGRLDLWGAGIKLWTSKPLFGLTREGFVTPVYEYILNNYGYSQPAVIYSGLHNIYITILVSSGFMGFIVFATLVFLVIKKFFVLILNTKDAKKNMYLISSFFVVLCLLILEIFESRILYQVNIFNAVFWIYFGYLIYFSSIESKKIAE